LSTVFYQKFVHLILFNLLYIALQGRVYAREKILMKKNAKIRALPPLAAAMMPSREINNRSF